MLRLRFVIPFYLLWASLAAAQQPNTLTEAEAAAGWQLMFDGKSLSGWHSYRKTAITDNGWIVKDSSIYLRGPAAGSLLAPEAFVNRNFEISIDWKVPDAGNSGIFLRYLETEISENVRTGPESQICGRLHSDYKTGTATTSPGACYAMYPPASPWTRPADQFNTFHVVMYEKRVAHFGNGMRLLEYEIGSDEWTAKFEASKYANFPLYGDIHAGKLLLQDHASPVWYRNIKIRPLAADPWANPDYVWPDQVAGSRVFPGRAANSPGAPRMRLISGPNGSLALELSDAASWNLGLHDVLGHRIGAFQGTGRESRILNIPEGQSGVRSRYSHYYLSGTVDGHPLDRPLAIRPTP